MKSMSGTEMHPVAIWLIIYVLLIPVTFVLVAYFTGRRGYEWCDTFDTWFSALLWPLLILFGFMAWTGQFVTKFHDWLITKGHARYELAEERRKTSGAKPKGGRAPKNGRCRGFEGW